MTQGANWKNVNNWHWVEKNCLQWTQEYFKSHFTGLEASHLESKVEITEVENVEGDVYVNVRKGKVIYIFDINLDLKWKGNTAGGETSEGTIAFKDCSYDLEPKEYEMHLKGGIDPLKTAVKEALLPKIYSIFQDFPNDLLAANGPKILVEDQKQQPKPNHTFSATKISTTKETSSAASALSKLSLSEVTKLKVTSQFKCPAQDLFSCLTDKDRIQIWTNERCDFEKKPGSSFSLMGNHIQGKLVDFNEPNKLVMDWRVRGWPEGHYSRVEMNIQEKDDYTELSLIQEGVPKNEKENIEQNWERIYFNRIKHIFGYAM